MSFEEQTDHIRLWPPIVIGGSEIGLEVEVHGAWVDGTYEPRKQRSGPVLLAIKTLYDLALEHRRKQTGGPS